jgi:hypothetical protein
MSEAIVSKLVALLILTPLWDKETLVINIPTAQVPLVDLSSCTEAQAVLQRGRCTIDRNSGLLVVLVRTCVETPRDNECMDN